MRIKVSTTGGFAPQDRYPHPYKGRIPVTEPLSGGRLQFELARIPDDSNWIPLGRIDYYTENPDEFQHNFEEADEDDADDAYTDGDCAEEIYWEP